MVPGGPQKPPTEQVVKEQQSIMNPTDLAAMAQSGKIRPDMSVAEYLQTLGIDPGGPVSQLVQFAKREMQKADPANKMKAIAQSQPEAPQPPAQQGQQMPQGQPKGGGMADLLRQMK